MKRAIKDWLIVLASLLDDAAIVLLVWLILRLLKIPISITVIIALILLFIASVLVIHRLVIPALRRKPATGAEAMIGLEGEVVEPLTPDGLVSVKGEYWQATSVDGDIKADVYVQIVGLTGLTLKVKRKNRK